MKIIITNLPSFYKINLYNKISEYIKIIVIYTGDTKEERHSDFFKGIMNFEYIYMPSNNFVQWVKILKIIFTYNYQEFLIGGWGSISMWVVAFFSQKEKNSIIVESSLLESTTKGIKGWLKAIFLSRISKAYVSGSSQKKLIESLGFNKTIIITKGVGVFNYIQQPCYNPKNEVCNFLFVGRLISIKNIEFIINVFNKLPDYTLNIVGSGELENALRSIAGNNVFFHGFVENEKLVYYYQSNDVFILPSISEPWGLVVEEALNNGLPVIVSDRVGCAEEIVNENNGLIFIHNSEEDLLHKINLITNIRYYNRLRLNISKTDFEQIEQEQVNCYL